MMLSRLLHNRDHNETFRLLQIQEMEVFSNADSEMRFMECGWKKEDTAICFRRMEKYHPRHHRRRRGPQLRNTAGTCDITGGLTEWLQSPPPPPTRLQYGLETGYLSLKWLLDDFSNNVPSLRAAFFSSIWHFKTSCPFFVLPDY